MKKQLFVVGILMVLFAGFGAMAFAGENADENVVKVAGSVIETAWDSDGNCTGVAVEVKEGENTVNYNVNMDDKGKELLKLVGKKVVAAGSVAKDEKGNITITVSEYEVQEEGK